MQENKTNYKKIFKKGRQRFQSFLGNIETIKENGDSILLKIKTQGKDTILFLLGIVGWFFLQLKKVILLLWLIGKEVWENIKKAFYNTLGILVALFCVSLFLFFIFVLIDHINPAFITSLHSQYMLAPGQQNAEIVTKTLGELITQGKVINASEVYNHMLEYYNTIITILIALLGVFGVISWFTIQGKAHYEVKSSIENEFESSKFEDKLIEKIDEKLTEMTQKASFWEQTFSKNKEEIISCVLKDEQIKRIIKSEKEDILRSHNEEVMTLEGVENGDKV